MTSKAPARPSEAGESNSGTPVNPEGDKPAEGDSPKGESFSREYVEKLREEAKENRIKAQRADFLVTEVRRYAIKEAAAAAGLTDPEALAWEETFEGEDGLPNHDRLKEAATDLVRARPWLGRPQPVRGLGEHSAEPAGLSLSELLRA